MKKVLLVIALLVLGKAITNANPETTVNPSSSETTVLSNSGDEPRVINVVKATDGGNQFRDFTIYGVKEPNGKWFFYIPYKGVNYGVRWSRDNRKFYVYIDYTNWYFWDRTLDSQAGNNNNGY